MKFIKKKQSNIIKISYIPTQLKLVDILTKPVSPEEINSLLQAILFKLYKERKKDSCKSENQGELQMETVHEPSR